MEDQAGALELWRGARELVQREPPIESLHRARRLCARYVRSILQRIEVSRLAGDALSPNLPQSRIAAWLSRTFRTAAHRLTNDERQRIEDLLDRLTRRYTLATERALSALADALPQEPEPACVDRLADELHALKSVGPAALEPKEVAVLLTLPAE